MSVLGIPASHPLRVRGLKQKLNYPHYICPDVAPPAGAWIETRKLKLTMSVLKVAPPAGAWIETRCSVTTTPRNIVAPPAGAWIETVRYFEKAYAGDVAPPAGAWIETGLIIKYFSLILCRTPCGCVD